MFRVSYRIFVGGGNLVSACAQIFVFAYFALSSHTILSLHTEVEVSQNSKKSYPVP